MQSRGALIVGVSNKSSHVDIKDNDMKLILPGRNRRQEIHAITEVVSAMSAAVKRSQIFSCHSAGAQRVRINEAENRAS